MSKTRYLGAMCALALTTVLPAYADPTVKSTKATSQSGVTQGVTYYLPMRLLKVTVSNSVKKLEELETSVAAARKALTAADEAKRNAKTEAETAAATVAYDAADKLVTQRLAAVGEFKTKPCAYQTTFELLPVQADTEFQFAATPNHSVFRDDNVKIGVSQAGLLTSANATVTDRTGDIIVELAGAAASFGMGPIKAHGLSGQPASPGGCTETEAKSWVYMANPASTVSITALNTKLSPKGFQVSMLGSNLASLTDVSTTSTDFTVGTQNGALFYRTAVGTVMVVSQKNANGGWDDTESFVLSVPQAGAISYVPLSGPRFVKTVNDVKFTDGSITSWDTDHPSEVLAVVSLPVKILKAIVSVPGEILSLKVDYSSDAIAYGDNQAKLIESDERLTIAKACVAEARSLPDNDTALLKCFD